MTEVATPEVPAVETSIDPIEASLVLLLKSGKQRGYVTWEQMNEVLPDDAVSPDKLELIMLRLDEEHIDMLDETEAEQVEAKRQTRATKEEPPKPEEIATPAASAKAAAVDPGSRRVDDPVR
ncbi:MAG: hypothetical protein IID40_00380, partial [Planctomycetes bacterium]|nr:hypothetical protein [Planctomycetota bacterium]